MEIQMNKLALAVIISGTMSTAAFANHHMEKIDSTFSSLDSNSDSMVSMDEVKETSISDYFSKMDKNGDNSLSENEYITYLQDSPESFSEDVKKQIHMTQAEVEADMDKVAKQSREDMDYRQKNVSATVEEGSSEMTQGMRSVNTEEHAMQSHKQDSMDHMEQDRDGDIARSSEQAGQPEGDVVARNEFDMLDENGDGQVTEKEASNAGVNETFSDMDSNDDNMITHQEYSEYRNSEEAEE